MNARSHPHAIIVVPAQVPSLPARNEWGERRREGQLDKITSSPHPSPPSCVSRRGGKLLAVAAFSTCVDTIAPRREGKQFSRRLIFSN
jgi:hypothetical protein